MQRPTYTYSHIPVALLLAARARADTPAAARPARARACDPNSAVVGWWPYRLRVEHATPPPVGPRQPRARRWLRRYGLIPALMLLAIGAEATPESLLRHSPFLPAGNVASVAAQQKGRLELRGIATIDGVTRFTIFDTSSSRGVWLAVGENDGGMKVSAYDAAAEAVTVELEGQSVRLTLKEPEIVTLAVSTPATATNAAAGTAQGVRPAPPANEKEIQERRNRIIEELRRRRAMRQANQSQQNPPPPNQ